MCLIVTNVIGQYWALKDWLRFSPIGMHLEWMQWIEMNTIFLERPVLQTIKKKANLLQPSFPP